MAGYLANVQCVEVRCEMDPLFYGQYLSCDGHDRVKLREMVRLGALAGLSKPHGALRSAAFNRMGGWNKWIARFDTLLVCFARGPVPQLAIMNPVKYYALDYLLRYHEARGDKIIVFSDRLFPLEYYAIKLKAMVIAGKVRAAPIRGPAHQPPTVDRT